MRPQIQYGLLAALRIIAALTAWGVVHPDELFQSVEVAALRCSVSCAHNLILRCPPSNTLLATTPLLLATIMFELHIFSTLNLRVQVQKLAALVGQSFVVHGWMFFVVSRLWMVGLSFFLDGSLFILLKRINPSDALQYMILFASSWPVLVLCVRPFSNTLEAVAVSAVIVLVSSKGKCTVMSSLAIAISAVAGVWIRVTTVAFIAPAAVYHAARLLKAREFPLFVQSIVAILLSASVLVLVDSSFYGGAGYTLTPLNLFVYNSNTTNLANHGLHPRITHAAVNMPMLMTAALPPLYHKVFSTAVSLARRRTSWLHTDALLAATVFMGIMLLSLFPHQEPRFLLPLLVPSFALLSTVPLASWSTWRRAWVLLNAVLFAFWGGLHQGALLPALYSLSSQSSSCAIAVAGTYSAPAAAVAKCTAVGRCSSVPTVSLEGASVLDIDSFVQTSLLRGCVFLLAPSSHPLWADSSVLNSGCEPASVFWWPHISTEFLPNMHNRLPVLKTVKCGHTT